MKKSKLYLLSIFCFWGLFFFLANVKEARADVSGVYRGFLVQYGYGPSPIQAQDERNITGGFPFKAQIGGSFTHLGGNFTGTGKVTLWNSSGTVLRQATFTCTQNYNWCYVPITPITLTVNATYWLGVYVGNTASDWSTRYAHSVPISYNSNQVIGIDGMYKMNGDGNLGLGGGTYYGTTSWGVPDAVFCLTASCPPNTPILVSPPNGSGVTGNWITSNPTFTATVVDPDGGTVRAYYNFAQVTGNPAAPADQNGTTVSSGSNSTWGPASLSDGKYDWRAQAIDSSSSTSSYSSYWRVKKDSLIPTSSCGPPTLSGAQVTVAGIGGNDPTPNPAGTPSGIQSGILQESVNGGAWTTVSSPSGTTSGEGYTTSPTFSNYTRVGTPGTIYSYQFRVTDGAGNASTYTSCGGIGVSLTIPDYTLSWGGPSNPTVNPGEYADYSVIVTPNCANSWVGTLNVTVASPTYVPTDGNLSSALTSGSSTVVVSCPGTSGSVVYRVTASPSAPRGTTYTLTFNATSSVVNRNINGSMIIKEGQWLQTTKGNFYSLGDISFGASPPTGKYTTEYLLGLGGNNANNNAKSAASWVANIGAINNTVSYQNFYQKAGAGGITTLPSCANLNVQTNLPSGVAQCSGNQTIGYKDKSFLASLPLPDLKLPLNWVADLPNRAVRFLENKWQQVLLASSKVKLWVASRFTIPQAEAQVPTYGVSWGSHTTPTSMVVSSSSNPTVNFTNTGSLTWNSGNVVNFSYHWYSGACPSTTVYIFDGARTALPVVANGGTVSNKVVTINTPTVTGVYCLAYDLVNEAVAWFSGQGVSTLNTTVTITLPPPTNLSPSGTTSPGLKNITWNAVSGATLYFLRVDDTIDVWNPPSCDNGTSFPTTGDVCQIVTTNSYQYNFQAGHSYSWWVHAYDVSGGVGPATGAAVTVGAQTFDSSVVFINGNMVINSNLDYDPYKAVIFIVNGQIQIKSTVTTINAYLYGENGIVTNYDLPATYVSPLTITGGLAIGSGSNGNPVVVSFNRLTNNAQTGPSPCPCAGEIINYDPRILVAMTADPTNTKFDGSTSLYSEASP